MFFGKKSRLLKRLSSSDVETKVDAARELSNYNDRKVISALVRLLGDDNWKVWGGATESLIKLNWKPETDNQRIRYFIEKREWEKVKEFGEAAIQPLLSILRTKPGERLYLNGRPVFNWHDASQECLNNLGTTVVVPLIRAYPAETSIFAKQAIVTALGKIGDEKAVALLIKVVSEVNAETRGEEMILGVAAVKGLGNIDSDSANQGLLAFLDHPSENIQSFAIDSIRINENPEALLKFESTLSEKLGNQKFDQYYQITELVENLKRLAWVPKKDIYKATCFVVDKMNNISPDRISDDDKWWEEIKAFSTKDLLPILGHALQSSHGESERAAQTMEKLGDPRAIPALQAVINKEGISIAHVNYALDALAVIAHESAIPFLLEKMSSQSSPFAQKVIDAILAILNKRLEKISIDDLQQISKMGGIINDSFGLNDQLETITIEDKVDCSKINELARNEISRRKSL